MSEKVLTIASTISVRNEAGFNIKNHGLDAKKLDTKQFLAYPVLVVDKPNANKRIYPKDVVINALKNYQSANQMGEQNPPPDNPQTKEEIDRFMVVDANNASHCVANALTLHEDVMYAYARPAGPKAQVFEALEEQGAISMGIRALCKIDENNIVSEMKIVSFDLIR